MNAKRILSAFLAAVLSLGVLVSCAGGDETQTDDTTPAVTGGDTVVTEPAEDTTTGRENAKDNIPADLKFTGETVNIVYRNEDWYLKWDTIGTDNSGEIIQDAIWQRNVNVEERFGYTMNIQPTQSTGLGNVSSELKNMVFAGSDEYDIIVSTANSTVTQSLYPYLYELSNVPHLDINSPWWRTNAIEELSFDGEHYRYLMGDNTLNDYLKCGVVYYNKDIYTAVTQADADEMYQLVLDGAWTWDKLTELTAQAYADLNGDGVANVGDQFGLMLPMNDATDHMVLSCGIETFNRTAEGGVDFSVINNEKIVSVIDKMIDVYNNTDGVWKSDKSIDASPSYFAENVAMLYTGRLTNAVGAAMREMESDYGILPMPKYDADQKEYITYIDESATVTCVLKTVPDARIEMVGATLEGWAAEAYRTVLTPFIETALKMKYSRDALSGQVIDIVFNNCYISFPIMYNANMNSLFNTAVIGPINSGKNNFSSVMAKLLGPAQKSIDKYITDIVGADQ